MKPRNLWIGILIIFVTLGIGVTEDHLYLQPEGKERAHFTNDNFMVTCYAKKDSSATRLTWQAPSGKDITVSEGRVYVAPVSHNAQALELVIEDVRSKDAGIYYCSAIVDGLEVTTFFKLLVYRSISFAHTPPVQVAPEGSNFTVFCNVKANPRPIMSWHFRGRRLSPGMKYQITEDGLIIHRITKEDGGNYTCQAHVVTPRTSQIKSIFIQVQVQYTPHWKRPQMRREYSNIGTTTNLTCEARANPAPSFEWLKDGIVLASSNIFTMFHEDDKSILQIKVQNTSFLGDYTCRATNVLGVKERTIALDLGVKPSPPRISVRSDEPGMLTLFLSHPAEKEENLLLLGYRVEYKLLSEPWSEAQTQEFGVASRYQLRNLGYGMDYAIRVAGWNAAGYGAYSTMETQTTSKLLPETVKTSMALKLSPHLLCSTLFLILKYIAI